MSSLLFFFSLAFLSLLPRCELPYGEAHLTRYWGQSTASRHWSPQSNDPWGILPVTTCVSWEIELFLANTVIITCEGPRNRRPNSTMPGLLTHRNCDMINICCFKSLRFFVLFCFLIFIYLLQVLHAAGGIFITVHELSAAAAKSLQSCPTLCDPIDSSPPGSSTHGIFQARVLEWGAIAFSAWTL